MKTIFAFVLLPLKKLMCAKGTRDCTRKGRKVKVQVKGCRATFFFLIIRPASSLRQFTASKLIQRQILQANFLFSPYTEAAIR